MSAPSNYAATQAAFDAVLAAVTAGGDIVVEGQTYQPVAGRPYLSCRLSAYTRTPMAIDPNTPFDVRGSYQVNIQRPANEGKAIAAQIADLIVALFPRGMALALGTGASLTVLSAGAQPAITEGDWLTVPVVVSWFGTDS